MKSAKFLFTSESVTEGHPDKVCDAISDAVVDALIEQDKTSRVACETATKTGFVMVLGEVTTKGYVDIDSLVREVVTGIGYDRGKKGFDGFTCGVQVALASQSPDISRGVDQGGKVAEPEYNEAYIEAGGAGDQGMMFGYACDETDNLMPLPITMSHQLCQRMDELHAKYSWLRPDGKSEVAINYQNGRPVSVEKIVLAKPFDYQAIDAQSAKQILFDEVVKPITAKYQMNLIPIEQLILNGTGQWLIGGPASDTGVTGRKIVVDTYGGMARIGGGCFSGKDPTKVDRSAAYAARFLAKNIVAAGLAHRCEVQLAYAIGYRDPIAKAIETFGTAQKGINILEDFAWKLLDLSVEGINQGLNLRRPIYQQTARYGHFGHPDYPWEKIIL